ncbi:hypothetical protein HHX47_DHR7000284 [Lentinula edodes]|nr:hypothetical protein HHX47_DHR7000284 [Lentinula edodes]
MAIVCIDSLEAQTWLIRWLIVYWDGEGTGGGVAKPHPFVNNIVFENNYCSGGHGISIGSIASDKTVSAVTISGNTVVESMYGMRIKVDSDATDASVSDITYSGNTISANDKYGLLISQSYSEDFGTPGTGSIISYALN